MQIYFTVFQDFVTKKRGIFGCLFFVSEHWGKNCYNCINFAYRRKCQYAQAVYLHYNKEQRKPDTGTALASGCFVCGNI